MEQNTARPVPASARNRCLDFFKGIAALSVIFGHIPFPGRFGKCVSAVGSCGILLFFIISGYHAYGSREEICPKLLKRFRRNLCITCIAVLVYFIAAAVEQYLTCHTLNSWLKTFTKPQFYLRMLFFSDLEPIHGDPLWFMFALLYAYLIFWLMYRLRLERFAKYAVLPMLLLRIVMEAYKYATGGDWRICSNVLVAALPLMLLGRFFAEQRERMLRIPATAAAVCGLLSLACTFLTVLYDPFRVNISQIFKLSAAASAFLFAMKKPSLRIFPPLSSLGGAYSLHVYLWHMPVIVTAYLICERFRLSDRFYAWYLPPIVAAAAILLSVLIVSVQRLLKKHRTASAESGGRT